MSNKAAANAARATYSYLPGEFGDSLGGIPRLGEHLKQPEAFAAAKINTGAALGSVAGGLGGQALLGRIARAVTSNNLRITQARGYGWAIGLSLGMLGGMSAAVKFVKPATEVEDNND